MLQPSVADVCCLAWAHRPLIGFSYVRHGRGGATLRKYYFDFLHDNTLTRDEEGSEHPSDDSARREMYLALLEIGRDEVRAGNARQLVGIVRDDRRDIWRGRLSLEMRAAPAEPSQV